MAVLTVSKKDKSDLVGFRRRMSDLFNNFFDERNLPFAEQRFWPAVDVTDNENAVVVKAEVPGCKAEDIDVSVNGNILTISGEKKEEKEKKEKGCYCLERVYGSFSRSLNLPAEVDIGKINAVCKDGILTLTLPKTEKSKAIKVKVKEQ